MASPTASLPILDSFFTEPPPSNPTPSDPSSSEPPLPRTTPLTDTDLQHISHLLTPLHPLYAPIPRLYTLLRLLNQLPLLDTIFLPLSITDHYLPFTLGSLPSSIPLDIRAAFIKAQPLVLTKGVDLEKGERGKHLHFGVDEVMPFESKGGLGAGGFGNVDRVVSRVSGKEYARKRLPRGIIKGTGRAGPKAGVHMRAFLGELGVLKRLRHGHVVEYVGSYTAEGHLGILMAPVAEGDLGWFMGGLDAVEEEAKAGGIAGLPAAEKRGLLRTFFGCLASALNYLHSSQIRHKDIKPQNILVMAGRGPLLTDFGLSLDWAELSRSTTKGAPSALTPRYAAPEVADHEPRGASSDVWSLGCVFLEMVTVLKGVTLPAMREFYESHGSESLVYRTNDEANREWMQLLEGKGATKADSAPLKWIANMLERERRDRPTAVELLEVIVARDQRTGLPSRFCGSCCLPPEDDSEDYDFGEDTEEEDDDYDGDTQDKKSSTKTPAAEVDAELIQNLRQVAGSLGRNNISSGKWWDTADKALALMENDTSLPPAEAGKLLHELVSLLRDASWSMLSGEITGSTTRSQDLAKGMLELLERAAMLSQPILDETTAADKEELSKCIKYISSLSLDDQSNARLTEAEKRLLGSSKSEPQAEPKAKASAALEKGADESDLTPPTFPLHHAAKRDDLAALTSLLAAGADANQPDANDQTPLHHAARSGSEACVIKLLSGGASARAEDARLLTPLHCAAEQGNRIVVRELLRPGTARLNARASGTGATPLHLAVRAGNLVAVELLLGAGAHVDGADAVGRVPLSYVSSPEMVRLLVRYGADVSVAGGGRTALHWAVEDQKDKAVVSELLDVGLRVSTANPAGRNALHVAVAAQSYDIVEVLLSSDSSVIDVPVRGDGESRTALHIATEKGDERMVRLLLDRGAQARFAKSPPLNMAVAAGQLELVKLLHEQGQDLNVDGYGGLPLDIAAKARNLPMARWLVEHGAQYTFGSRPRNQQGFNALHQAIDADDEELVTILLDSLGSDAAPGSGAKGIRSKSPAFTAEGRFSAIALYSSIFGKHHTITRILLDRGADPDGPNRVPLLAAVYQDDFETAQLLLDHGADLNKPDSKGEAAIHWVACRSSVAMAELLVANGVDVNQDSGMDSRGFPLTPVYHALMAEKADMVAYLVEQAGAKVHLAQLDFATTAERGASMASMLSRPAQIVPSPPTTEKLGQLLAEATKWKSSAAAAALIKAGAGAGADMQEALYHAIENTSANDVALLIEAGADSQAMRHGTRGNTMEQLALASLGWRSRAYSRSPKEEAELEQSKEVLRVLLGSGKARGERRRQQVLQEWLRYAGASAGPEVVKWLYGEGAEGNVRSSYKYAPPGYMQSPLQYAVDNDDVDMARERLAKGEDVSGLKVCHTPLQLAARNGNMEMLRLLLDHGAAAPPRSADDVGIPPGMDSIGETALLHAVEKCPPKGVQLLLDAGADPNRNIAGNPPEKKTTRSVFDQATHRSQWLPLAKAVSEAVRERDPTVLEEWMSKVRALLEAGADPAKTSSYGGDALSAACGGSRDRDGTALLTLLLNHCAESAAKTGTEQALSSVARAGKVDMVNLLLDRGAIIGNKLLWNCTATGNEAMVRLLVQRGADPDAKGDGYGRESAREKAEKTYDTLLIEAMNGK
ncbi:ankyrin repeat-containing domain protein [Staphylotrichum tortipilum]|uniref:Ankyrin repeat-containing domain protein n=1 Tax=Staphylotrichum tortipilum TaxID=2831512 RepID=A0AAN6MM12_9PEZI|nr:ankyrin repeat-containing domain protein [Staphylotrichum longicolle]